MNKADRERNERRLRIRRLLGVTFMIVGFGMTASGLVALLAH